MEKIENHALRVQRVLCNFLLIYGGGDDMPKLVAVNEHGLRIGEDHPHAKLTNHEVELLRRLHNDGMTYDTLAAKFEISKWAVGRICRFERRGQFVSRIKRVHVSAE